ncbi:MAG: DNA glycosylase AlkZ-like family protein, partial [Bdellovibrionota bacterium]
MSLAEARRIALSAQGLSHGRPFASGGTLGAIEHLGYVQIDTISVIERAHHHVLWTRVPEYRPSALAEL